MADFNQAFTVVMQHEDDPVIRGKITRNNDGRKASALSEVPSQFQPTAVKLNDGTWYYGFTRTRFGVDERAHPELKNGGFFSTMGTDAAFAVARNVFHAYWTFDQVTDQIIATKLFDACINAGPGNALQVMQSALKQMGKGIFSWHWGPAMLNFINGSDPVELRKVLTDCMIDYYNKDAKKQGLKSTPGGWLARAKWPGDENAST